MGKDKEKIKLQGSADNGAALNSMEDFFERAKKNSVRGDVLIISC